MLKTSESQNLCAASSLQLLTGTVVPLGALVTENCPVIGEFPALIDFAFFCKSCGLGIIQLLPVNDTGAQSSPYSGLSAFALHPIYISIAKLPEFSTVYKTNTKFHSAYDIFLRTHANHGRYDYQSILNDKTELLKTLYKLSWPMKTKTIPPEFTKWIENNPWIIEYAVYKNIKAKNLEATWKSWDKKDCRLSVIQIQNRWNDDSLKKEHLFYAWVQFRAYEQFQKAANAVKKEGIILKGDIPIMMNEDSCDVWAKPDIFDSTLKAGSPPDEENRLGQSWGFPIYNWKQLASEKFRWWKDRLISAAQYYEAYRLDHILGFFRIWAIPVADTTAYLGHTEPYVPISRSDLNKAGFDDNRIKWLSQPHIPTGVIEDITWNHESAYTVMSRLMTKIDNEELWNFKKDIKGDGDIFNTDFTDLCTKEAADRIKQRLAEYWRDRCLIEVTENSFVCVWSYSDSTAWKSLSWEEKQKMESLFRSRNDMQELKWEAQASTILPALTKSTNMVPCGEDLGVNLKSVPSVLRDNGILGLRVVRWNRKWNEDGQPFVPFSDYEQLSVTTTSVHDSPTLRQWWESDKEARKLFVRTFQDEFNIGDEEAPFSPGIARSILLAVASSASIWCINPIQDFLYLSDKYTTQSPELDQINIPGTVTQFNWTYRLPVTVEELRKDTELQSRIREITCKHTRRGCL